VDSTSQLYLTDLETNALWRLNKTTQTLQNMNVVTTGDYLGDSGPLSNARFNIPRGLAIDVSENILISDQGNSRLRGTYTFGFPQTPVYLTMNFKYTNYFASTGTAYIGVNGNILKTFYGSIGFDDTYVVNNVNIFNYPLRGNNPVYQDQTPYIEITQTDSYGYTKLDGTLFVQQVPSQRLLENSVDATAGIQMNSGVLTFPYTMNGTTLDNRFNDLSTRSILYSGQLLNASDPALKEEINQADIAHCYSTFCQFPLKRYTYIEPYISTFNVQDIHRLGFLTSDIHPHLPKSLTRISHEHAWGPSTVATLDTAQIKMTHYGATQYLMELISTLEEEVERLVRRLRLSTAQRNNFL
jgi:hypothetical protein